MLRRTVFSSWKLQRKPQLISKRYSMRSVSFRENQFFFIFASSTKFRYTLFFFWPVTARRLPR